jgi:hypothetical protein
MSEKRPQHSQEPAEGSEEAVEEAAGAERAGEIDESTERPRPTSHPEEPAEGGEEDVEAPGAERPGNGG